MILAITMALSGADAPSLQRQDRQDTIYIIRGSADALTLFQKNIGVTWTGGAVLDADPSDGTLTYWAYSDRTAAESRQLMIPAIMSGLQMGFEKYQEAQHFPIERAKFDQVAAKCGAKIDPFFLTPKKSVEITWPENASETLRTCLHDGVRNDVKLTVTVPREGQAKK